MTNRHRVLTLTAALLMCCVCRPAAGSEAALRAVPSENGVLIVDSKGVFLRLRPTAWGGSWYWLPGKLAKDGNALSVVHECKIGDEPVRLAVRLSPAEPRRIEVAYEFTVERDFSPTMIAVSVDAGASFQGKDCVQIESPAGEKTFSFPMAAGDAAKTATAIRLKSDLGTTTVRMDPGIDLRGGAGIQLLLGQGKFVAGQPRKLAATIDLPADHQWCATPAELPDEPGIEKWFPWQPKQDVEGDESVIGMQKWLDPVTAPADRIVNRDGRLMRGDRPIRLWGINSNYIENFPEKPEGARRAAWFAKYGINCVRLHKMSGSCTWEGMRSRESCLKFDPAKLDNLDSYTAELRKRGVYYAFSPNYPFTVGIQERDRVESWDEIARGTGKDIEGVAGDLVWASPRMQGLLIEQICLLLNHVNPYTGLAYKDDPALAYVECINEQSLLFYSNLPNIAKKPTYKRLLAERFSDWLKQKYGSHEALVKAWGEAALKGAYDAYPDEHLDKRNIFPGGSPWFWDPAQMAGSQKPYARRFLDHMAFLTQVQDEFYSAWTAAVRKTGYQGMIECSNWQAGRMFSHYYNLRSDALGDIIDRHNYFGGVLSGFNLVLGDFNNDSMLARPGSGSLSSGLQQVQGRAFGLSEWIHCLPNEWGAEGPAILGAYGFGLQGWDTSFIFTQAGHKYPERIDGYIWNAFVPTIMGAFPAISRQVLRGDVEESPVISTRRVCAAQFIEGKGIDFEDTTTQSHDVKSFDCDRVPTESLARGRVVVQFTDTSQPSDATEELKALRTAKTINSVTGQLSWTRGDNPRDGFFTMDTPATKAVVGFAKDRPCQLGPVTITHRNPFAAVYVTCLDRDETDVTKARRLLVLAVARCRNKGQRFLGSTGVLMDKGTAPVIVEPVVAEIRVNRTGTPTVHVLDHDGRRTGRTLPATDGRIVLDGAENKTIYYEIEYR
jgi:hypothetical protein